MSLQVGVGVGQAWAGSSRSRCTVGSSEMAEVHGGLCVSSSVVSPTEDTASWVSGLGQVAHLYGRAMGGDRRMTGRAQAGPTQSK